MKGVGLAFFLAYLASSFSISESVTSGLQGLMYFLSMMLLGDSDPLIRCSLFMRWCTYDNMYAQATSGTKPSSLSALVSPMRTPSINQRMITFWLHSLVKQQGTQKALLLSYISDLVFSVFSSYFSRYTQELTTDYASASASRKTLQESYLILFFWRQSTTWSFTLLMNQISCSACILVEGSSTFTTASLQFYSSTALWVCVKSPTLSGFVWNPSNRSFVSFWQMAVRADFISAQGVSSRVIWDSFLNSLVYYWGMISVYPANTCPILAYAPKLVWQSSSSLLAVLDLNSASDSVLVFWVQALRSCERSQRHLVKWYEFLRKPQMPCIFCWRSQGWQLYQIMETPVISSDQRKSPLKMAVIGCCLIIFQFRSTTLLYYPGWVGMVCMCG